MRRADRLFRLLFELRRGRVTTARRLAARLEVSERTIYRDVADLVASGVPIEGEAGVGYRLRGFELPPLMFSAEEIEALVFGARMVESWGDGSLAHAAGDALGKIEAVLPMSRAHLVEETRLYAPTHGERAVERLPLTAMRAALRERRRVFVRYVDEAGRQSERTLRPLALAFFPPVWLLVAWCELRAGFRSFRVDRCRHFEPLDSSFELEAGKTLADFNERRRAEEARA